MLINNFLSDNFYIIFSSRNTLFVRHTLKNNIDYRCCNIIYNNRRLCSKLYGNNTVSHSLELFTRMRTHAHYVLGEENRFSFFFFFSLCIVPIGSPRFDGQEDPLYESNENTIKATKKANIVITTTK